MTCPTCGSGEVQMCYDLPDVYDGISFYRCTCGAVYSRWTGELVPDWDEMSSIEAKIELGRQQRARRGGDES